ncbi:15469_t:CDS:2, partial [Entrophospora sp. SA101]
MSTDPPTFASNHLVETEYEALKFTKLKFANKKLHWIHSIESLAAKWRKPLSTRTLTSRHSNMFPYVMNLRAFKFTVTTVQYSPWFQQ